MSKTVSKRWLKDKDGILIVPKTLSSQVIDNEGKSLDRILQENEQRINEKINEETSNRLSAINDIDTRLETIEKSVGEGGSVDEKIADAIKVETDARNKVINDVQKNIETLIQTQKTDKKNLVDSLQVEVNKAREEEEKLDSRLVKVETFFETAENETLDTALDTLVEMQKYVTTEGAVADQMILDIAANKKAIEDHVAIDHDFSAVAESIKNELNTEISKKADKVTVEAINGRVETAECKIETIENKLDAIGENAEANVIEKVKINGVELEPNSDKAVDITIPTGTLASKNKIEETDLDEALIEKVNTTPEELHALERLVGVNAENIGLNTDAINAERKRIDKLISLPEGSTTGDAELMDGRIGVDGTEYESIGTAIRTQITDIKEEHSSIPNAALLSGNYIKFYKTDGDVYSFLFERR